jgi:hypothetical protein
MNILKNAADFAGIIALDYNGVVSTFKEFGNLRNFTSRSCKQSAFSDYHTEHVKTDDRGNQPRKGALQ